MNKPKTKEISLPLLKNDSGSLIFLENYSQVPFEIQRVFFVKGKKNNCRGNHAHYNCSQFLICIEGSIEITCDNGNSKKIFLLDNYNKGILIPPLVWATQHYKSDNSILAVICDMKYNENDYIRDYESFKKSL